MSKADEDRVRPRPEGDPANGPWFHYMEEQAEQDRKAKFIGDEELRCFAHERSWEAVGLTQLLGSNESMAELLIKAFYLGRASANRERPHARRMVSEALNACHIRYQKAAAEAFSVIMQSRGAE
jgi:hypothetical protein